jgi:hypothetical protein
MERRSFIRLVASSVVAVPVLTVSSLARSEKQDKLPAALPHQVLTSRAWNDVIDRVNDLSERVL